MVNEGILPRAALRQVEARLTEAGCPDADFDAAELFRLAVGADARHTFLYPFAVLSHCPLFFIR